MSKSTCSVADCPEPVNSRGMCKPHYRKDYYQRNKARENATNKAYREARPEYWKERWQEFYQANQQALSDARKVSYRENRQDRLRRAIEYRRANPGKSDAWRKRNPEKWALANRENQRRRRGSRGERPDYGKILERDGMVCHICSEEIPSLEVLHFDHVIPLSKGGPHSMDNIKPSHAVCNLSKGAKLIA